MTRERERAIEVLSSLMTRIERLRKEPANAPRVFDKIVAPVYRMVRWQPDFKMESIEAILEHIRGHTWASEPQPRRLKNSKFNATDVSRPGISSRYFRALAELRGNVRMAELGIQVHGRIPATYAIWLNHIAIVMRRISPLLDSSAESWDVARARAVARVGVMAPLCRGAFDKTASVSSERMRSTMIDALINSANSETERLDRRRRLLEAARQLLIESNASLSLRMDGVKDRHALIVRELTQIGRLEAAGIVPSVSMVHQLREARQRGEWERLHAGLVGLEELSIRLENAPIGPVAHRGIRRIWRGRERHEGVHATGSALRSVQEMFGATVLDHLGKAVSGAKVAYSSKNASEKAKVLDEETLGFVRNHLDALDTSMYVNGLLAVDGTFDVGGVLTPTRVIDEYKRTIAVRYPTSQLTLMAAEGPTDIPDCVIEDPRTVLASLASGKLLARRFVHEEVKTSYRTELQGELRVYLLDGSTSMLTRRAVLRDSILIAELCTLIERFNTLGRRINPTLYFQYFNTEVGPVIEVRTAAQAADAIDSLLSTVRTGGTNIQAAILRSIAQIREASRSSADLARANIVLITDGDSAIDEKEIVKSLESLGELQTAIHIIALGVENPSLCALARAQKLRGRRAFYQYVDEESILSAISGKSTEVSLHPPKGLELQQCVELLEITLDEISSITRIQYDKDESDALIEKSLEEMDEDEALRVAMAGRIEVARRDRESLVRRFKRWFPVYRSDQELVFYEPDLDTKMKLETILYLLQSLIELGSVVDSDQSELQADTIEIFQRMLYDSGVSPLDYAQLIARFPKQFDEPLRNLYRVVGLTSETTLS